MGYHTNGRLVLNELDAALRDNESFRLQINEEHHLGESEFLALDIDMVYAFSIDYMHAVCLGIMKKLLMIWIGKDTTFNHRRYRITNLHEMNYRIDFLYQFIPSDLFARRPRKIDHVSYWKATEFRLFLLYTGHIILKDLLPIEYYNNFMCLSISMLILINSNSNVERISYAKNLLRFFINDCENLYGNCFCIYNVHMLSHIADDRLRYTNLDYCSSFKFENYLGMLKRLITSGYLPLKQIINRIEERKHRQSKPKIRIDKIKIGNVYIISEKQACQLINNIDTPLCKLYDIKSIYKYPCNSCDVGIYSAISHGTKFINKNHLIKRAIIIKTDKIYDEGEFIIQALQHLF